MVRTGHAPGDLSQAKTAEHNRAGGPASLPPRSLVGTRRRNPDGGAMSEHGPADGRVRNPYSAAIPAAGLRGVSPRERTPGETSGKPADEDARATNRSIHCQQASSVRSE